MKTLTVNLMKVGAHGLKRKREGKRKKTRGRLKGKQEKEGGGRERDVCNRFCNFFQVFLAAMM